MIDSCTRLMLEIGGSGMPVTVKAKRGDTGRVLRIALSDGGVPYRISEDCYGMFTGRKSDGTTLCHACTVENNMIVYAFTDQTCAAPGCITAEIRLYGSNDKLLTSASFLLEVQDTVWHEGDVESRDQIDALDQLILETVALKNEVEEKLEKGDFTGPRGEKGDRGEPGADGETPEKGVDYYTEAERQELIDRILQELPEGGGGGDNVLTVIFENAVSSHSPYEIMQAVREGKHVFALNKDADKGDPIYYYIESDFSSALFGRIEFNGGLSYMQIWKSIKVNYDKTLEYDGGANESVPLSLSSDIGKVLTRTENGLTWEEPPGSNMWDSLPSFDLNEMGMPVIRLDGVSYYCECDTTELMAAMDRSIVRISADIDTGTRVFKGEAFFMQAMSVSEDIHQAIVRGTINDVDDFYDFRLLVREGIIYLSATLDAGGKTPEKGVDYWTEADKAEIKSYVDDAILGGAW